MVDNLNEMWASGARFVYTYTGRKVGLGDDTPAPSLEDIAVGLGRICRYAGGCQQFWPVLLHSFVVADMLPKPLKIYGLLHDAAEILTNDIPRPFKTEENSATEAILFAKILKSFNLSPMNSAQAADVKAADNNALFGESWTIGNVGLRTFYKQRCYEAEDLVRTYARRYPALDCIDPDGIAVVEFKVRFRYYLSLV